MLPSYWDNRNPLFVKKQVVSFFLSIVLGLSKFFECRKSQRLSNRFFVGYLPRCYLQNGSIDVQVGFCLITLQMVQVQIDAQQFDTRYTINRFGSEPWALDYMSKAIRDKYF